MIVLIGVVAIIVSMFAVMGAWFDWWPVDFICWMAVALLSAAMVGRGLRINGWFAISWCFPCALQTFNAMQSYLRYKRNKTRS